MIAATNQNLESLLAAGRFRKDLFYRLNVIALTIPPLRERPADVVAITRRFLDQTAREAGYKTLAIDRDAQRALCRCEWPGNVRELAKLLGRSVSALEGDTIRLTDLPLYVQRGRRGADPRGAATSLREMQSRAERENLLSALRETGFNKVRAARMLGIHRTLLYKKMRKYNLPLKAL